ncbi:MAG: toxin [Candidatus Omnitrophica bacterium]|jgi:uncharacterized DUF497 family protein|nr:toxin [Candidatus Omnitrophota bacterium]
MKHINWNSDKSTRLKKTRGICFEDIILHIENGNILDDYEHPNKNKYTGQRILVIGINKYAYLVPYIENDEEIFLKTIIPSRKATKIYFGEKS